MKVYDLYRKHREEQGLPPDRSTQAGFPYMKDPGPLYPHERRKVEHFFKFFVRTFDLTDAEELEQYRELREMIVNRVYIAVRKPEPIFVEAKGGYIVHMEWVQPLGLPPR